MNAACWTTFLFVTTTLLAGCDMCGNEISQSITSPSGELKAVVFNRNCGATVNFNTQICILSAEEELPDEGGNVLIVDGRIPMSLQWQSDSSLLVVGSLRSQIFKQETKVSGVRVQYADDEGSNSAVPADAAKGPPRG